MTGLVAESLASKAGQYAAGGQPVQSVELNANHLRAVPVGEGVVVIAKPLMKGARIQVQFGNYHLTLTRFTEKQCLL